MKKISSILLSGLLLFAMSCKESEFIEAYPDPAKLAATTIEKQFTGMLQSNKDYVLPGYRFYFVTLRTTINHYVQTTGWVNGEGQYIPGSSGVEDVWFNYYNTLAQYRELQRVFAQRSAEEQKEKKIFMLAATVYMYDYTQKLVDLHGSIPFTEAGLLSANNGDYAKSIAKFDSPQDLYTKMLDDLKSIAAELNTITLSAGYQKAFTVQDFVNYGDLNAWKRYTNSLRLRMLNRVSDVESLKARSNSEIAEILGSPTTYPIVETNAQNIQMNVYDLNSPINSTGLQGALESGASWYINFAGKKMIDHMKTNADPRLPIIFQPGINAKGEYFGIDPTANATVQAALATDGMAALYNRVTFSGNHFFPGVLINAAEVNLIKAEYYLRTNNDAKAQTAYETAIDQSVNFYNKILSLSKNILGETNITIPATANQITAYLAKDGVNWTKAGSSANKLALIAEQKWLHYNITQPFENWSDVRRLDLPKFSFVPDNSNNQTLPPYRWTIPSNEITYNPNYSAVKAQDNLTTKIFWDVK
ncbi:SusD/RagB family nutrient-binding outer membrane lipoprotein [Runella limosa]|uniref:SusD/RagB family nutrient-binding outer membrane lipoprotein n=1 Tax=Runella limosa TaxID=370978 RepID=UPI00048D30CE|nr:SusD/RagB family nutrient-binding outer membrane lipoprotein [Runella limosa]